ncbi:hypothetical protein CDAR_500331 [Caerostris darwini]|uniref:Uncharacterized protein n=1 Tax=Caerostris darwini TaxID=1538125 RepID=A0AAV4M9D6_9ARAC|nr:hypothetical protein CDAR_500331 [Caerostris darwini]
MCLPPLPQQKASSSPTNTLISLTDEDPGLGLMMNTDIESHLHTSTPPREQGCPNDAPTTHKSTTEHDILDMDINKTDSDTNKNS